MMAFFQPQRLYRSARALAVVALLVLPACSQVMTAKEKARKKGPRAIAVVRWQMDARGKALPRLFPIAILDEGKYYDASLYRATPRPMSIDPGVVYEAQDQGEVLGYFTVKNALRDAEKRRWWAQGEWETSSHPADLELRDRPQSLEIVKEGASKPNAQETPAESVDDRDIKKKTTVYDEEGKPIPEGQPIPPDEKENASLKRKQGDIDRLPQIAPPKKEAPKPAPAEDDPDRPRIKRGTSSGQEPAKTQAETKVPEPPKSAEKKPDDDPNRPILKRGGKGQQKIGEAKEDAADALGGIPVPARVQARGDVEPAVRRGSGLATRTFEVVAVSDAGDTNPSKIDFRFRWTASEREELTAKMRALAQQEATKYLGTAAPGKAPTRVDLTDRRMAGLDLDFNNSAELVYSGTAALPNGRTLYVTVAARLNLNGEPRKLASVVTSSDRLDVLPRLEFVDAVDADGDGHGELLFRRLRDRDGDFIIYRAGADRLVELFHGGSAE